MDILLEPITIVALILFGVLLLRLSTEQKKVRENSPSSDMILIPMVVEAYFILKELLNKEDVTLEKAEQMLIIQVSLLIQESDLPASTKEALTLEVVTPLVQQFLIHLYRGKEKGGKINVK